MTVDYFQPQPHSDEVGVLTSNPLEEAAKGLSPRPDSAEIYEQQATANDQPRELDEEKIRRILADYASGTNKAAIRTREQAGGIWSPTTLFVPANPTSGKASILCGRDEHRKSVTVVCPTIDPVAIPIAGTGAISAVPALLTGYTIRNSGGVPSLYNIFDNAAAANGTLLATHTVPAGETVTVSIPEGVEAVNGIFFENGGGAVGSVWTKPGQDLLVLSKDSDMTGLRAPGVTYMDQGSSQTFTHTDPIWARVLSGAAGVWVGVSIERYE